tara:strand:+ start:93 stop:209 length:117 start_codon:yes stop_codon:yes gene_type:complete
MKPKYEKTRTDRYEMIVLWLSVNYPKVYEDWKRKVLRE